MTSENPPNKHLNLPQTQPSPLKQQNHQKNRFKFYIKHEFDISHKNIRKQLVKRAHFGRSTGSKEDIRERICIRLLKGYQKAFKTNKIVREFHLTCAGYSDLSKEGILKIHEILKRQYLLQDLRLIFSDNKSITNDCLQNLSYIFKRPTSLKTFKFYVQYREQVNDRGLVYLANAFKRLRSLADLSLSFPHCSQITEKGIEKISRTLKPNNSPLQNIHLNFDRCHKMTYNCIYHLSEILKGPVSLQTVYLNFNAFRHDAASDEWLLPVADALKVHTNLKELHLELEQGRNITHVGVESLSKVFKAQTCIEDLTLKVTSENITDKGIVHIKDALKDLVSLRKLHLGLECDQTDEGAKILGETFDKLSILKDLTLNLDWCHLTDKGFEYIGQTLTKISSLEALTFTCLGYGDLSTNQGMQNLMEGIQKISSLKKLFLDFSSSDELTDEGYRHIAKGLEKLRNLEEVQLIFDLCTQFTDEGMKAIAESLQTLPSLKRIHLDYDEADELTEEAVTKVFDDLLAIPSVQQVHLTSNFTRETRTK